VLRGVERSVDGIIGRQRGPLFDSVGFVYQCSGPLRLMTRNDCFDRKNRSGLGDGLSDRDLSKRL